MFKFQLEPLITIRNNELKKKQAELAKAYEARRRMEELGKKNEEEIAENLEAGRKMINAGGEISADYLMGLRRQEMFLQAQRKKIRENIAMIDEEIERRRAAVIEANKSLKMVERLKEGRYEKYLLEERRKETAAMDEAAAKRKYA
ncbi:MAG: flagellar export protein FliJ [Planctomycetaceae bacterium]|nr:flagellar export protein FliJ [Planctomycetaceae bacterium]